MVKKKGQITEAETDDMFEDILDRIPGSAGPSRAEPVTTPPPSQPAEDQSGADEAETVKVSLYLTQPEIDALDLQIIKRRQQTGKSPRRSHLIREAIQLWLGQQ
jgi:hypothetical protein